MTPVSEQQIRDELQAFVKSHKSDAAAARAIPCTPSQLSLTLAGKSGVIPARILAKLGYTAQTMYVKSDEAAKPKKSKKTAAKKKKAAKKTATKPAKKAMKKAVANDSVKVTPKPASAGVKRIGEKPKDFISVYNNEAQRNENADNAPTTHISLKG